MSTRKILNLELCSSQECLFSEKKLISDASLEVAKVWINATNCLLGPGSQTEDISDIIDGNAAKLKLNLYILY